MEAITNAMVRGLRPRDRVYEVTCGRLAGFAVRVLPTGKKVFVVRLRVNGRDQRRRLGLWSPELEVEEARRQAMAILAGEDVVELDGSARVVDEPAPGASAGRPSARRRGRENARRREAETRSDEHLEPPASQNSVREIAERFVREYVDVYLKPSSAKAYRRILELYILPELGERPFASVTRRDVKALHAKLYDRSTLAEYVLCVLGSLYTRIIDDWELVEMRNPTSGIKRRPSRRVERFLSPEERRAVVMEIERGLRIPRGKAGHVDQESAWAIMLLMHTGQRRNEVITMRWEMVDWQHACIHFPDTKTGQRSAPVSSEAMALLREIHDATGSPRSGLVIHGRNGGKLTRINTTWDRIRRAIGIADVRLHDLRHSFASDALMAGVPLAVVGEMLGHKQVNTTKRYAHLADHVVRSALETTAKRISKAYKEPLRAAKELEEQGGAPFVPLTDAQWATIAPLLGVDRPRGGVPVDLRGIVDGIRWVQQRKARWRDVPERYGMPTTCWRWFKRWTEAGVWAEVMIRF